MIKFPENKTRKRLRIAQCILYLLEIYFCTMPFIQGVDSAGNFYSYSVLGLISFIGGSAPQTAAGAAFLNYVMFSPILMIIPIIGFFFCALDKQRNLKNLVSLACCFAGIIAIIIFVGSTLSLGSLLALLVYLVISFLTTLAMFARISSDNKDTEKK